MLLVLWVLSWIQRIICYLVWISLGLGITAAILMYLSSSSFMGNLSEVIVANKLAIPEQIDRLTMMGGQVVEKVFSFFK